ncbi:MAG: hypothetical protein D6687_00550 [Acidobacteria bacterium]|jgi:hypothetical protein|nr:MAG: hypothetical protein D6687_00550 [Acidobacteriota bacterium]GIU81086.1 MAG: hypothetical protein KatS3mg006_0150 [Pyrinomonadaceae bacterium]
MRTAVKISAIVLAFILASAITLAQNNQCKGQKQAKVPAIKGLTYHKARKKLLAAGWRPLPKKSVSRTKNPEEIDDPDILAGNGPIFWQRGYVELESCSGTGLAYCSFLFKDAYGNRLQVVTSGEELPEQRIYAKVNSLKLFCRGQN